MLFDSILEKILPVVDVTQHFHHVNLLYWKIQYADQCPTLFPSVQQQSPVILSTLSLVNTVNSIICPSRIYVELLSMKLNT